MAKDNKNQINIYDLDAAEKQANVGMKKPDPAIHKNIAQIPETDERFIQEIQNEKNEKRKRLGLLSRFREEQEEDEILDTQIISHDLIESSSRSNTAERFNPTVEQGLGGEQVKQRQREGLINDNQRTYSKTYRQIFFNNIFTFFNVLCIIVAVSLILVSSWSDLAFLFIIVINTIIGITQEIKAKKTIDKLSIVTAPTATVVRDSLTREIAVNELVLDDIVKLKNGKQISADSIIISGDVEVNEALLTGESENIKKGAGDSLYAGSYITAGTCFAKVNRVGKDCYIQKLQAKAKRYSKPKSELLRSLKLITTFIAIIIIPVGSIVAWRNYESATATVEDASFATSGSLMVYGETATGRSTELGTLNDKVTVDGSEIPMVDVTATDVASTVNKIRISYDNKVSGNISISRISIYDLIPTTSADGITTYTPATESTITYVFNSENANESLSDLIYGSENVDRYADGTIRLDSSGDYITVSIPETENTLFQVRVTLRSRAYTTDTSEEIDAMNQEKLRLTVTKTAGSLIGMIPAGMFLLVTIALAVSVLRLSKTKTLVQELYCIEMLARVDCICLDKTGTITDGTMRVKEVIDIAPPKLNEPQIDTIMGAMIGALEDNNQTSIALQDKFGINFEYKKVTAVPFSSSRKMSAVTFEDQGTYIMGAPEFVYQGKSKKINSIVAKKASMGYRVLMLAKSDKPIVADKIPQQSVPVALLILEDHIRAEAPDTIRWFNENGVQVKVISGDNPATVAEIAGKVGIVGAIDYISLEGLSPKEVETVATEYTVFGRVSPDQKAILVKTLKRHGKTVAMTGDGVNDILAMKESDCSVAMASGSEAARNVAHLVLLDSNFANMPKVVLEGRRVINNIQRSSTLYLMKTLFTMCLTLLSIFATNIFTTGYPFVTQQFMLLEMFIIGLPSYVIALQPNKNKIKGSFLSNIFGNCFSQAVCLLLAVLAIFICRSRNVPGLEELGTNIELTTSLCVIAITYTGFIILTNVCRPFNTLRTALCVSIFVIITVIFSVPEFASIFGVKTVIKDIGTVNLLFTLVVILSIIPIARFFSDFIQRIKNETRKENGEAE